MDKNRAEYEKTLKENEKYPLNSLTRDQRVRFDLWVEEQEAEQKRSEAAKKAAETREANERKEAAQKAARKAAQTRAENEKKTTTEKTTTKARIK